MSALLVTAGVVEAASTPIFQDKKPTPSKKQPTKTKASAKKRPTSKKKKQSTSASKKKSSSPSSAKKSSAKKPVAKKKPTSSKSRSSATRTRRPRPKRPVAKPIMKPEVMRGMVNDINALNARLADMHRKNTGKLTRSIQPPIVPIAVRFRNKSDSETANDLLNRSAQNPNDTGIIMRVAAIQVRNHKFAAAEKTLVRGLKITPLDQNMLHALGNVYLKMGAYIKAWNSYQEIIYLNPNHLRARLAQGAVREAEGNPIAAQAIYKRMDERFGPTSGIVAARAENLILLGEAGAAVRLAEDGIKHYPDSPDLYVAQARGYYQLGMPDRAKTVLYAGLALNTNLTRAYLLLGDISMAASQYVTAVRSYEKVVELEPGKPEVSRKLGRAYVMDMNFPAAIAEYNIYKFLNPNSGAVNLPLAQALFIQSRQLHNRGDFSGAVQMHNRALDMAGGAGIAWRETALLDAGEAARLKGSFNQAVDYYEMVIAMNFQRMDAYMGLSRTYESMNDYFQARMALRQALNIDPDHEGILILWDRYQVQ